MRRTIYFCGALGTAMILAGCTSDAPPKQPEAVKVTSSNEVSTTTREAGAKGGSASKEEPKNASQQKQISDNNEGYALLYSLLKDDGDVSKIFIIKHVGTEVNSTIKDIAAFAKDAKKQLDDLAKADHALSFDKAGLPKIEQESRDLTKKADTKALLMSSGPEFERRLVFLQAQAMGYANDLATALKAHETDAARKKFLNDVESKSDALEDRLIKLLAVKQESK